MSAVVSGPVAEFDASRDDAGLRRAESRGLGGDDWGLQAAICLMQDLPDRRRNAGTDRAVKRGFGTT